MNNAEHTQLKAQAKELGRQKLRVQNRLSMKAYSGPEERKKLVTEAQTLEKSIAELNHKASAIAVTATFRAQAKTLGLEDVLPPVEPDPKPYFDKATLQHLRLLAVRIRSEELRLSARMQSAQEFVAIVDPFLKREEKLQG